MCSRMCRHRLGERALNSSSSLSCRCGKFQKLPLIQVLRPLQLRWLPFQPIKLHSHQTDFRAAAPPPPRPTTSRRPILLLPTNCSSDVGKIKALPITDEKRRSPSNILSSSVGAIVRHKARINGTSIQQTLSLFPWEATDLCLPACSFNLRQRCLTFSILFPIDFFQLMYPFDFLTVKKSFCYVSVICMYLFCLSCGLSHYLIILNIVSLKKATIKTVLERIHFFL